MSRFLPILGSLSAIALGLVFVGAGLIKSADPALFAEQINGYKMTPESWGLFLAYVLIIVELVLGAAVILHVAPRLGVSALLLLLVVFVVATGWAWAHGNVKECGCFGRASSRGPLGVIVEDLIFIGLGVLALRYVKFRGPARKRWATFLCLVPLCFALPFVGPRLPVDRWVTPIGPGADLSTIAIDGLREPISEGRVLLAMVGPECAACDRSIAVLDELASSDADLHVVAVLAGDKRAARAYRVEHVPSFPIGHSPAAVLRQYYRKVPVFVLLRDGVVEHAWWGEAPSPNEVRTALAAS